MPTQRRKPTPARSASQRSSPELVRAALARIPADLDRETWVRVGMALKASELGEAEAAEAWHEWSAGAANYSERAARDTWRSFKVGGRVTVATLFGIAQQHGFEFPKGGSDQPQTPARQASAQAAEKRRAHADEEAAELLARQVAHAERCERAWAEALTEAPAIGCPYLVRKEVKAHGLRFLPGGVGLVPMRDAAGRLWSVQRLLPQRLPADKRTGEPGTDKLYGLQAQPGERVSARKSGLWHLIGSTEGAAVLLLAEGYATAASLHEATGYPVAVAFDAGNLVHVAPALRELHPALPMLVCGDDDHATARRTGKNPGRLKAEAAARLAHTAAGPALAVFPRFAVDEDEEPDGKDFNDLATTAAPQGTADASGPAAVRRILQAALAELAAGASPAPPPAREETRQRPRTATPGATSRSAGGEVADNDDEGASGPPAGGEGGGGDGADPFGGRRDAFVLDDGGVWFHGRDREGNDKPPLWLCAPLAVTARTRADDANGWGCLLEFGDPDGNAKTWAMPSSMLSGDGAEWAGRLRDMGLRMAPGNAARTLVAQYIDTRNPAPRVTCTDRVGWHSGGVYVLPSGTIGGGEERRYVFQSDAGMEDTFRRSSDDLGAWREQVAGRAAGNSRLMFALCCAFAGPMLRLAGMESGGFHFRGISSQGKTTALKVAASVWGRPSYMQRWRTTDNALEATAVQHCDGLLILDEFAQLDPRVAGECAYMLANDQEKGRATRGGLPRKRRTWRLLFLSSGEVSLAGHMAEAGRRTQAGMEVRMVDVPLDAGVGMGGIEELHEAASAGELSDAIAAAAARQYGTAGRTWLEWACAHHDEVPELLRERIKKYQAELVPEGASEQVRRVGSRFALVAAAGELATTTGITGWAEQQAAWAVRQCFGAWLAARGHLDNGEEAAMISQVRAWVEKNGEALLSWYHRAHDDHKPATPLRGGFKRLIDDQGKALKFDAATDYMEKRSTADSSERQTALVEYLLLPEAFRREVCKGFDPMAVARALKRRGHLVHEEGRLTIKHRLPLMGKVPCFHIRPSILADANVASHGAS